jgi:hypothetical protein
MHRASLSILALFVLVTACDGQAPAADQGLAVHQRVIVANEGTPEERQVEVLEDARITEGLRYWLWGGSKEASDFLHEEGLDLDDATRASLTKDPLRHGLIRLVDGSGKVLDERKLDCELGEVVEPALTQGETGQAFAFGDDCSTGTGDYAGLITRFFTIADDKFAWQTYPDAETGEKVELTLVQARKITWHLVPKTAADEVFEVSTHPEFAAPAGKPAGDVTDYLHFRYDGHGGWTRKARTLPGAWNPLKGFPPPEAFPD